jgi:PAS domain S-box-containing protein
VVFKTTGQKLILQERDAPPYGTEQKDILSRLQIAESSLKAIQAEYQQVLNHESHGIRIINKDFTIRLINRCFAEMTGVRPEEATGRKCYDFFASPFCQTSNCRLKLVLRGASSLQAEMERTKPDGEKIPCLVSASPFRNENGKIAGVIETFSDITERQKLEKEILESEERYRALVELGTEVGEAIVMLQDMDGVEGAMVFMSEQWPKMTGYSRDELLRLTFFDLLHPRDKSASLERHRTKMLGKKIPGLYEMTVIRKDGKEVPV